MRLPLLILAAVGTTRHGSHGCYIAGTDSGVCDVRVRDEPEYAAAEMPFCGPVIAGHYTPCVPEQKPIAPDRNFNQEGRWVNHTTLTKDQVGRRRRYSHGAATHTSEPALQVRESPQLMWFR